ncbi:hypothetical protein JMJ77_0013243 [Colletotrichum scovillei]|uniref:Uncharacterized protein n=1 Tax=Colletotrichum scovillei TaxID=1209932 RepID=A0A9P7UCW3_9PEZI|nr:hypothetical protein JMJ77_0013243 [Colletotrichum scovillei]KAG7069537.1 hypothetical protein JMJ76_0003205 [Colletotrichum scovillei]KAG7073487.1 hypothetical protein JMJ78_0014461 [Colletotrichum scovillei]
MADQVLSQRRPRGGAKCLAQNPFATVRVVGPFLAAGSDMSKHLTRSNTPEHIKPKTARVFQQPDLMCGFTILPTAKFSSIDPVLRRCPNTMVVLVNAWSLALCDMSQTCSHFRRPRCHGITIHTRISANDQQPTIVIRWNSPTAAFLKLPTESH